MEMEGKDSFHVKTKAAKPNQPCKPTTYWAGVLMCGKNLAGPTTEEDYLWVKCHHRVTADKILQQYKVRNPTEDVVLRINGRVVGNDTMKMLDVHGDQVIAFEAVKKSDIDVPTATTIPRKPLHPSGRGISQPRVLTPESASLASDVKKERQSPYSGAKVHGHLRSPSKPKIRSEDVYPNRMDTRDENLPPYSTLSPLSQPANAATASPAPRSVLQAFRQASNEGVSGPFSSDEAVRTVNPPFMRYLQRCRVSWEPRVGGLTEAEIQYLAWESWIQLSSEERAPYYNSIGKSHCRNLPAPLLPDRNTSSSTTYPLPPENQLSGGMQPSGRQGIVDKSDSGFMKWLANMRETHIPMDEKDKVTQEHNAWESWMLFTPEQRESYSAAIASRSEQVRGDDVVSEIDFKDQFTTEAEPPSQNDDQQTRTFQLQNLIADASLDVLESSVERGVRFLDDLKGPLLEKVESSPDAAQWVQQIDRLRNQAVKTRTVIGVVGNTGAGKSSVINAMLDEERLVPTNTMRACTAVVTELSYNYDDDAYRAEVEFITIADWEKELQILFKDLLDDSGNVSRDCANPDTDAGIAYAKIKAVYPKKTKEDISNSNIKKMLQDVSHLLGNTRKIKESDSLMFYKGLQHFVDSKEKVTGKKDKDKKNEPKEMEFWPLIKVVRIFVKSPALATGAVIVDLPGVHDANAARAAIAEGYMKQCTGLWIVAPIIRAVDDKAAKNLLGESFKRQLKMDGGFSSVTFICSKTDDISLTEASDSLGLDEENGPAWEEMDRYAKKQKQLKKELEALAETKTAYGETVADVDEQLEVWEELEAKIKDGNTVYPPNHDRKRKKTGPDGSRKKARRSSDDDDDDFIDDGEEEVEADEAVEEDETASSPNPPLTEEQVTSKISELRTTKKEGRRQRTELDQKMKAIRTEIAAAKEAEKKIESQISKVCIEGRNAYSKGAIQQDFAAGMKELDQEIAAEDDEENFNPEADIRDYDEVARSLPVFCVSSRGYQKLQGRLKKDPAVPGFQSLEQTEIPQLQAHCKQLTVAGRTTACKRFMTNLSQLLNSMNLWASNDGTGANLTPEQRAKEAKFLQKSLENLETGLEKIISTVVNDLKEELADNIYDRYETAVAHALVKATQTCSDWGRPVNREDSAAGGYYWSSYKAVCRRNGIYSNAQGPHDWNQALSDPMLKVLAGGWERTFTRRAPAVLAGLAKNAGNLFKAFHRDIDARARQTGASVARLHMLQLQLQVYEDIFKDLSATTKESIDNQQKDINREFVPVIEKAMTEAYDICTNERGPGSYARMKAAMIAHVERQKHTMFEDSTSEVQKRLKAMLRGVDETMSNKADEVFIAMSRDYRSVLGSGDVPHGEMMPKWQRAMRKEVKGVINKAEKIFKRVAGMEVEDDEDESEAAAAALDHAGTPSPKERVKQEENHLTEMEGIVSEGTAVKNEKEVAPQSATIEYGSNVKMEVSDEKLHVGDAPQDEVDVGVVEQQPQEHPLSFEETTPPANLLKQDSASATHTTRQSLEANDHGSPPQVRKARQGGSATSDEDYESENSSSENASDGGSSSDEA